MFKITIILNLLAVLLAYAQNNSADRFNGLFIFYFDYARIPGDKPEFPGNAPSNAGL
jgi:hypothetical protein